MFYLLSFGEALRQKIWWNWCKNWWRGHNVSDQKWGWPFTHRSSTKQQTTQKVLRGRDCLHRESKKSSTNWSSRHHRCVQNCSKLIQNPLFMIQKIYPLLKFEKWILVVLPLFLPDNNMLYLSIFEGFRWQDHTLMAMRKWELESQRKIFVTFFKPEKMFSNNTYKSNHWLIWSSLRSFWESCMGTSRWMTWKSKSSLSKSSSKCKSNMSSSCHLILILCNM